MKVSDIRRMAAEDKIAGVAENVYDGIEEHYGADHKFTRAYADEAKIEVNR